MSLGLQQAWLAGAVNALKSRVITTGRETVLRGCAAKRTPNSFTTTSAKRVKTEVDLARAGLDTFGLVHEHKSATFFTSRVRGQNVPKKRAPKIHVVAPITIAATPADSAGGGDGG